MRSCSRNISSPIAVPAARSPARARPGAAPAAGTPAPPIASISCAHDALRSSGTRAARAAAASRRPDIELAHEARAHEQLVARGLGVGRVVAQRGNEGLRTSARVKLGQPSQRREARPRSQRNGVRRLAGARVEGLGDALRHGDRAPRRCRSPSSDAHRHDARAGAGQEDLVGAATGRSGRACARRPRCRARAASSSTVRARDALERAVGRAAASRARRRARANTFATRGLGDVPCAFSSSASSAPRRRASCLASALFR